MPQFVVSFNGKRALAIQTDYSVWGIDGPWLYYDYLRALETFGWRFTKDDVIPWNNSFIFLCEAEYSLDAIDKFRKRYEEQWKKGD